MPKQKGKQPDPAMMAMPMMGLKDKVLPKQKGKAAPKHKGKNVKPAKGK